MPAWQRLFLHRAVRLTHVNAAAGPPTYRLAMETTAFASPHAIHFDADLIARYDVQGPRYTSYPTAVQFTEAFGEQDYLAAARATNDDPIPRPLSLYVHIPFCASPCFYCACNRVITRDPQRAEQYLQRLYREIELQATLFDPDRTVEQLHLGGGTPTFLSAAQLAELMGYLDRAFNLCDGENREFSIEIDPRTVYEETFATLAGLGFNRVSFGIQDFDPSVQRAVNRLQSVEDTRLCIDGARRYGFRSVSVDLIYGLPLQTPAGFADTLDTVIDMRPDRIAVYGYAHLPRLFKAQRQINESDLPSPAGKLDLLRLAIERLSAAGYVYIGMDHFALPDDALAVAQRHGSLQRNFQGYSTHAECDLVGLGMSAIGNVGDVYAQNARLLPDYYRALDGGHLPIVRGVKLNSDDRLRREVIQRVMCDGALDFAAIESRFGIVFERYFAAEIRRLRALEADGLVSLTPTGLTVTPVGRLLLRIVAMVFDAYLPRQGSSGESPIPFSRVI